MIEVVIECKLSKIRSYLVLIGKHRLDNILTEDFLKEFDVVCIIDEELKELHLNKFKELIK